MSLDESRTTTGSRIGTASQLEARWNAELLLSVLALTLVIASVPVRNAQYVLPWVVAVHVALAGRHVLLVRLLGWTAAVAAASIVLGSVTLDPFNENGVVWGAVTYGTLLFWLAWPRSGFQVVDTDLIRRRGCDMVAVFIALQSTLGITQFVLSGQPIPSDSVTGTLDPLQFSSGASTLSQPSLAVLLIAAMLFVAALAHRRFHTVALVLGVVCVMVSQSGHQVIMLVVAGALVVMCVDFNSRAVGRVVATTFAAFLLAQLLTPETVDRAPIWFERTVTSEDSLKRRAWSDSLDITTDETLPGLGTGTGQYSSRAGLIASGEYLSVGLPEWLTGRSEIFVERVEPRLETFERVGEGSAIAKPYSSATTLLVELGPVVTIGAAVAAVSAVLRHVLLGRLASREERRVRVALATGVVFVAAISFVENYLELAQAVFLPGVLYFVGAAVAESIRATELQDSGRTTTRPRSAP